MLRQRCPHCQREIPNDAMDGGVAVCDCRGGLKADVGLQGRPFDTPNTPLPRVPPEQPTRRARPANLGAPVPESPRLLQDAAGEHPFRTKHEPTPKDRPVFSIDGYEIKECRGKGGMGQVYRALQKSLGREVAIKTLDLNLARHQASIMRFTKEAAAMAHLRHPNIVQVIDRGSTRDRHYFVMEFVDGPSLRELLREGAFAPQEALQIMLQLARTMSYAHKQGVIHRDLKPENILYTGDGVLKVADFGLAGVAHETTYIRKLTRSFVSMGTECYMAPEQRRDAKNVDFAADLYSMGVIFYELLTNQLPFPQLPPASATIAPGYPQIDEIIRICLQPDPQERYGSTDALVHALEQPLEQAAAVGNRDTVIDTPGVALSEIAQVGSDEPGNPLFESRLSGWSGRVRSVISDASEHVSVSWQSGNLRRLVVSGVSLTLLAAAVGLFFLFSPAPPSPKATAKEKAELIWKEPANLHALPNKQAQLTFDFKPASRAQSWRRRLRPQWQRDGFWMAEGQQIEQNTYRHGLLFNHKHKWALYQGHTLTGAEMTVAADLFMQRPVVTAKDRPSLALPDALRQAGQRSDRRHATIGLGLRGEGGQRISFVIKPRGHSMAFSFSVRSGRDHKRLERGSLREAFRYGLSMRVSLSLTPTAIIASVNGRKVESIQRQPTDRWDAHAGLICRDAHCIFQRVTITGQVK